MNENLFKTLTLSVAVIFTVFFCVTVIPPLIDNPDIIGAFSAGFVNPYASGYSTDVILCWAVLAIWVVYEAQNYSVQHGWVCLLLGVVPGVAVGLSLYLLLRHHHFASNA
ncbi:MAG: DUF2834 domain-containing protein [Pseudomonadota bacterium]